MPDSQEKHCPPFHYARIDAIANVLEQLALSIREGKTELLEFNHEREAEMIPDCDDPGRTQAVLTGVESVKVDFRRRPQQQEDNS